MFIRRYQPKDWSTICLIHDKARIDELKGSVDLAAFLTLEQTYQNEGLFDGAVWVCETMDTVVGFVAFTENELTWLYVSPNYYRKSFGRALLKKVIEECHGKITTELLSGNKAALQLYLNEGFEVVEIKKGKLMGNEDFEAEGILLKLNHSTKYT